MLKPVLIGLVVLNGALLAAHWGGAGQRLSGAGPREHEPERLQRQMHPEWLRVTPAVPASGAAAPAPSRPASGANAAAAVRGHGAGPGSLADTLATALSSPATHSSVPGTPAERVCLESGPFDAATLATAQRLLREAGVPERAWQTTSAPAAPRHVILMGRYADPEHMQRKTGELRRRGVTFTELHNSPDIPAKYLPGLVLGRYADARTAETALAALQVRGVVSARLVTAEPRASGTLLRVAAGSDDGLRARTAALVLPGRQGWRNCSAVQGAATAASARLQQTTAPLTALA
jgi:hypothetical protein